MLRSQGVLVNRTEVDTPHNQALVTLDPSSVPGAQSIMTKRYGPGLAFAPAAPRAQPLDARYNPPQSKVNGGQDITDGNGRCTANISISSTKFSKGSYFVMTAGHCFHKGVFASQNGSDANLFAYTASKSIGHVAHTPVYNGATTNCDCEALGPISASRASSYTVVNHDNLFKFDFYAQSNKYFTHSPRACEDGISEYLKFGHIICGNIDNARVTVGECEVMRVKGRCPKGVISYTVTDMIHVKYDHGADPLDGDSGAPTGNGPTLLGQVTDGRGDSSKARNMSDIYHTGRWIVPGH